MICQKCKKNKATTYITRTINGVTEKLALCSHCAAGEGFTGFNPVSIGDLFAPLFGNSTEQVTASSSNTNRCPKCGTSLSQIMREGKVGCAECYTRFYNRLLGSIERIHGNAVHVGKLSGAQSDDRKLESQIKELESKLKEAIDSQNFEEAAVIRDRIKTLKGESGNEQ